MKKGEILRYFFVLEIFCCEELAKQKKKKKKRSNHHYWGGALAGRLFWHAWKGEEMLKMFVLWQERGVGFRV
jgi:hypothetical protein